MKRDAVLQEYLDKIADGEDLPDFPRTIDPGPFQPDIDTARRLAAARPAFDPRPGFVSASRRRVLAQLSSPRARKARPSWLQPGFGGLRSPAFQGVMLGLLVLMLFFNAGRLSASSSAWLPGDLLYPLKPLAEDTALLFSIAPEKDAELHIEYANRRLVELQALALEGRYDEIPAVVGEFDRHVTDALVAVSQVSGEQQQDARRLALRLDSTLSRQIGVVSVLSGVIPGAAGSEFHRLLSIAVQGMASVRYIVPLESGAIDPPGVLPAGAANG